MTEARGYRSNLAILSLIVAATTGLLAAVITTTVSRLNSHNDAPRRQLLTNDSSTAEDPPIGEESLMVMQFSDDPHATRDKIEMIKLGEAKLASLRLSPDSLSEGSGASASSYSGVYGIFCVYDDKLNKDNPAVYPTVDYMVQTSNHCIENRYTLPLDEVIDAVATHDGQSESITNLPISGMLFHEGFSGAGLIANVLTTFDNTLVISEHSAIRDALSACDYTRNRFKLNDCSSSKHQKLIEDVVSLLSRSCDPSIEHMFLKLDSSSSAYIPLLRTIYPVPWTFDHRNSEQVLARAMHPKRNSCSLSKRQSPSAMALQATEYDFNIEELSTHEVCALHLSTLVDVASSEHESTDTGMLISYENDLLKENALIDTILPYLGMQPEIDVNPSMVQSRVNEVLSKKTNMRGIHSHDAEEWVPSEEVVHVSDEVRAACLLFMH